MKIINGPIDPQHCPFAPRASIVLDEEPIKRLGGRNELDKWLRRHERWEAGRFGRGDVAIYEEGDFLYFRWAWLANELQRLMPLFRRPVGDLDHWQTNA